MKMNKALKAFRTWGITCTGLNIPAYDGWQIICMDQNYDPVASVIQHKYSYGSKADRLEIAWIDKNGDMIRNEDVVGWLTLDEVVNLVAKRLVNNREFKTGVLNVYDA